jgi:hypothetical protein
MAETERRQGSFPSKILMNKSALTLSILVMMLAAGISGCQSPGASRAEIVPPPVPLAGHANAGSESDAGSETVPLTLTHSPQGRGDMTSPVPFSAQERGDQGDCESCGQLLSASLSPRDVFRQDREDFFPMLARDAKGLINWHDLALLGGALGGAIAIRQDLDGEVRKDTEEHPVRWGEGSEVLGYMGEVQYQVPVLLGVYGYSLSSENEELHDLSRAMISAYTSNGFSTLAVKGIANTDRPSPVWNDGNFGFPSFHTSSSFSVAAVVEEYHGIGTALPVYALAGLIGWSRIDERNHDLSDVVFGAAMGYVIGKSVARQHKEQESQLRLVPYSHPLEPASGIAAEWQF